MRRRGVRLDGDKLVIETFSTALAALAAFGPELVPPAAPPPPAKASRRARRAARAKKSAA